MHYCAQPRENYNDNEDGMMELVGDDAGVDEGEEEEEGEGEGRGKNKAGKREKEKDKE
jgi:hypothetical protein